MLLLHTHFIDLSAEAERHVVVVNRAPSNNSTTRAFSLLELVLVIFIMSIIGAIALPRFSSASENTKKSALIKANISLQNAIDHYTAEHEGLLPHFKVDDVRNLRKRLTQTTTIDGTLKKNGIYGPYLDSIPTNPYNGLNTVRSDGVAPGKGTHGWRYDRETGEIQPDHST